MKDLQNIQCYFAHLHWNVIQVQYYAKNFRYQNHEVSDGMSKEAMCQKCQTEIETT